MKKLLATLLAAIVCVGFCGACSCNGETSEDYTYRTYTTVMPSNWNELNYEDANDLQVLDYIASPFFQYDFKFENDQKFKSNGEINAEGIVPGGFTVNYSAATKLEDVTSTVDAKWGYTDEMKATGSYAWKITLRQDLTWEDGTPIDATDFVYTMQQQLDPAFQNMRASTYYNNIQIHGSRDYVYQGQTSWFPADGPYKTFEESLFDKIVFNISSAAENKESYSGAECSMRGSFGFPATYTAEMVAEYLCSNYISSLTKEQILSLQGKTYAQILADEALKTVWDAVIGWWQTDPDEELDFFVVNYTYPEYSWEDVGMYSPSKYELVVCLDAPIACLKDDGSLSYEAAYSFSSLPLVKRSLYESCKKPPQEGATLPTTNYNTSKETTASWGPYKLVNFQAGKSYTLERNDKWYGYALESNKNQYKINRVVCEEISVVNTQWTMFLSGQIDSIALDVDHKDDYRNSKYTIYQPATGTFGVNIYSNLDVLKASGRNNGILAIKDFRKAFALYVDRDEYNSTCFTSHRPCYGLLGPSYYYDVENGGVYRDTQIAKEGLLRVYGFTENEDGSWTDGTNIYGDYEEAYASMNGMNRTLAKELVQSAYKELTENAETYGYDASKNIEIKFGFSTDNESLRRRFNYFTDVINKLVAGTPLEGKIVTTFDSSFGSKWAEEFKAGSYDIASSTGFQGGAFDPEGFLQCYVDPEAGLMYTTWWDTSKESMTFTMPEGDYEGAGQELTMSVYNWYCCLNGIAASRNQPKIYNWGAGFIPKEARMRLLSKIEEVVLEKYFTVITTSEYSATVLSAKFSEITDEYNTFMGFGGIRYRVPNYNDSEWESFVAQNNNDLSTEYKKSE